MDISTIQSSYGLKLPQFFLIFVFIYVLAHKLFQNWNPKYRYEACSCFLSLFHGTPSVILALIAIFSTYNQNPQNPFGFASQNTPFQNLVLEFSTAYFIMDLLHYIVFKPGDVLFIAHHLATLFVLLTCRFVVDHGGLAILIILVLAEVTSPCQNVWSLARLRKRDVPEAATLYNFMSPGFYAFYTVARGVLAPPFAIKLGLVYANGSVDSIPIWVRVSWMIIIISGISVSLLWILNHWIVFYKDRVYTNVKKKMK